MKKYTATLLKDTTINVTFESTDMLTGVTFEKYSVPSIIKAGPRSFKTLKAARTWVDAVNADHPGAVIG